MVTFSHSEDIFASPERMLGIVLGAAVSFCLSGFCHKRVSEQGF